MEKNLNKKEKYEGKSFKKFLICFCCGEKGHKANECPKFKERKFEDQQNKEKNDKRRNEDRNDERISGKASVSIGRLLCATRNNSLEENLCTWNIDSGATEHMSPHEVLFNNIDKKHIGNIEIADGSLIKVMGRGSIELQVEEEFGGRKLILQNVLFIPDVACNILSVRRIEEKDVIVNIQKGWTKAIDNLDNTLIFQAKYNGVMYNFKTYLTNQMLGKVNMTVSEPNWHERFGHMKKLPLNLKSSETEDCKQKCEVCLKGKSQRKKFYKSDKRAEKNLDIIHSDVVGKIVPISLGGSCYFSTFLDDYSRFSVIALMKKKHETFNEFKKYEAEVEVYQERKIKVLHSDNGGEYLSNDFKKHLEEKGIIHYLTVSYTPQQNGRAERLNQTLMNIVRCLLLQSGLPDIFWAEALHTANYLRNFCCSAAIEFQIPWELWHKKELSEEDVSHLRVFGCQAWSVNVKNTKLSSRAEKCIFIGYPKGVKGYKLYSLERKIVLISRDVIFEENIFPYKNKLKKSLDNKNKENVVIISDTTDDEEVNGNLVHFDQVFNLDENNEEANDEESEISDENPEENQVLRRSTREIKSKTCACCNKVTSEDFTLINSEEVIEPKNVKEAMKCKFSDLWKNAMNMEMENIKKNKTWDIVERPKNKNIVGTKWVFKVVKDCEGQITKFKARIVAQGYTQVPGIDFFETYSPVINRKTVKVLLALAVEKRWCVEHIDVNSAFLYSPIQEEIYVEQPKLYEKGGDVYVCKLNRSLYGLHQASKDWFDFISEKLKKLGLKQCASDPCVFIKEGFITGLHVDDFIVTGEKDYIEQFKRSLSEVVNVKDLGNAKKLLSLNVTQIIGKSITVNQTFYANDILMEYGMSECRKVSTPLPMKREERKDDENSAEVDEHNYRNLVGSLLYLANTSRPDLSFAVNYVSRFCSNPKMENFKDCKHILRYIRGKTNFGIKFEKTNIGLYAYVDADWGSDKLDRKSVSGFVILLSGGAISWCTRKQKCVALSTAESEYVSMKEVLKEVLWFKQLLCELGFNYLVPSPITIYCDNQGAIHMSKGVLLSERTKHIDIAHHFIKDCVKNGDVEFKYVETNENAADVLTKTVSGAKIEHLSVLFGLVEMD